MSLILRIILLIASILNLAFVCRKLAKSQLNLMDALFWIVFSVGLMIAGIFPNLCTRLAEMVGVVSPVNLVYLIIIFLLIIRVFLLSIRIASMENRLSELVEELAIRENISQKADGDPR